jgi:hypothetical protein
VYFSEPAFKDQALKDASVEFASAAGHDFPKWVVDQAYFFLRDICHRHQHHSANDDTILITQYRKNDDSGWRRNILYTLHYQVIRSKRSDHGYFAIQATGILAYAMSFRAICEGYVAQKKMDWVPNFNEASQRLSLETQINQAEWRNSRRLEIEAKRQSGSANVRAYILGLVAIVIAFVGVLVQPNIHANGGGQLDHWSKYATEHLPGILLIVLSIPPVGWASTSDLFKRHLTKDVLEASLVNRRQSRRHFILLGVILVAVAFYFGRDAVAAMLMPFLDAYRHLK